MITLTHPAQRLRAAMAEIVVGNESAIDGFVIAALAGGHVLVEGVPGTAKTLLARLFGQLISADVKRVQFTPDLTPTDLIGTMVYRPQDGSFTLREGPVFTDILIADEINRTPPKTQSALLEVMEERTATIDGVRRDLSPIFLVCATQNPIDFEGTYPLPEAQLDRFLVRVRTEYPTVSQERSLLERFSIGFDGHDLGQAGVRPVVGREEIIEMRNGLRTIRCAEPLQTYMHDIVLRTRSHPEIALGASSRGLLALIRATQAMAIMHARAFATPDDVKAVAPFVLAHRIIVRADAEIDGVTADALVASILNEVPVPLNPAE